jgi:uncharacterized repeat protein (TIGR03803 family)
MKLVGGRVRPLADKKTPHRGNLRNKKLSKRFKFGNTKLMKTKWLPALLLPALLALLGLARANGTTQVIYSFAGGNDGEYTDTDLVIDSAGNLYGTSVQGGNLGGGTVFRLSPSVTGWIHSVLYNFTGGADGGEPYKGVTLDARGNLYGTTVTGGGGVCEGGCGVVFQLSPHGDTWRQTVIHTFAGGTDGSGPGSGVTFDRQGNLYGMTPTGGAFGLGTIYELLPNGKTWDEKILHDFTGGADGSSASAGRLIFDPAGNLYGVATAGGANGKGAAFKLTPVGDGTWTFQTLYSFKGQPDAGFPYGGLVFDRAGNLYGTTYYDGANNLGSVYELHPVAGGAWEEKVLYSFKGGKDGASSIGNLVLDAAGDLYGTTSEGGASCSCGTVFKLTPGGSGKWMETVVYRFHGAPDGGFVYNGMVGDGSGTYYGATVHGGTSDDGTIYQFTP